MSAATTHIRFQWLLALPLLLLMTGCDQPQITTYRVPKPKAPWQLPDGWRQVEARVGVATFAITGPGGTEAQVNLTPLPAMNGRDALIINMWRSQVGLPEVSTEDATKQLVEVEVGADKGKLFEVANKAPADSAAQRIITAMVHRPDLSWFFKLAGDDALVSAEKPKFITFLKSINVAELPMPKRSHSPGAEAGPPPAPRPATKFNWKVPAGWEAVAPGQMVVAKFATPAAGAANADVTVSIFPSDTGGQLANVNRWRGQLGLDAVEPADLPKLVTPLDPANQQAILVDMTNTGRRMVGAVIPRGGQWYFYKLLGDEAAVAAQKNAFVEFVKSEP